MNNQDEFPTSALSLIDQISYPFAFAGTDYHIIHCNSAFHNTFNLNAGVSFLSAFNIEELRLKGLHNSSDEIQILSEGGKTFLIIKPVYNDEDLTGYSISAHYSDILTDPHDDEYRKRSYLFQTEWENILALLLKEKSLDVLSEEILMRTVNLSKSSFGILLFVDEFIQSKIEYKINDEDGHLTENQQLIPEIKSNLSYILQWIKVNRKSLIVKSNEVNNIGYNLIHILQKDYISVTPCTFDNTTYAIMIFARSGEPFSLMDINILEQLATLFAFTISNTVTQELNAALESKLLQSQKLETIGKLASGMAHDFNNLLSSIFGSLNLLKRKLSDRQEINYLLENIENCSARAADLTKGLLSFGKPTPKRRTMIKPADLIKELLGVVQQTFPDTIQIEKSISSDLHDIVGNATEIYQVLLNLCINAKEAITGKGTISITIENFNIDSKKIFDFPLLKQGNYVKFSVKDTGEGISESNLVKIFDPYFSTKQKDTGSGLGLYVTYGIVKAHSGYIDVTSKPKQGTRFDIYIPAFEKHKEESQIKTEKIILLADDEIMLRDLLAELLESYNFDVVCVQDGTEVLKVLTEELKVDLLIIDYKMPVMDGITCIKKMRESQLDIPVILSTGSTSIINDNEFKKLNVNCILNKPYEFDEMLAEIQKLI